MTNRRGLHPSAKADAGAEDDALVRAAAAGQEAAGLAALGFGRGERMIVVGDNRPRLYWSMCAVQSLGGVPVPFTLENIKGVAYAMFPASTGTYVATYVVDNAAPAISGLSVSTTLSSATLTWTTDEAATSRVDYGISAAALTTSATNNQLSTAHSVVIGGLDAGTTYYFRVISADTSANTTTVPAPPAAPSTFATTPSPYTCPCTIWPNSQVPALVSAAR